MSTIIRLDHPRDFGREARLLVGAGALSGVATRVLQLLAGTVAPELAALSFASLLGLAANLDDDGDGTPTLRLVLAIGAGALTALLWPVQPMLAGAVGGTLLGGVFSLDARLPPARRAVVWASYGICLMAAVFVTQTLGRGLSAMLLRDAFTGAAWGVFLAFASGLKRMRLTHGGGDQRAGEGAPGGHLDTARAGAEAPGAVGASFVTRSDPPGADGSLETDEVSAHDRTHVHHRSR